MKVTPNQIYACDALKMCMTIWQYRIDITPQNHFNLIETVVQNEMRDYVDDELKEEIIEKMKELYRLIKKIK